LLKAEMSLAKEIHDVLVPEIKKDSKEFDIYGKSVPTSEVGGDLVDVIERNNEVY
jgi:serine phosphatase RsbU (regulator of sigma subunit)